MYPSWPTCLLSTLVFLLCNPRLPSAFPLTPDDTANGLYPSNPPSSANPTSATTNLTALHLVHCFPEPGPGRLHPSPADCIQAISAGILTPNPPTDVHKFYDWSYNRGTADFILPGDGYWRYKTCEVVVRNQDKEVVASFSLDEVGFTAQDVVRDCVGDEDGGPPLQMKNKGGFSRVGTWIRGFYVAVYGVPYSAETGNLTAQSGALDATVQRVPLPASQGVDTTR